MKALMKIEEEKNNLRLSCGEVQEKLEIKKKTDELDMLSHQTEEIKSTIEIMLKDNKDVSKKKEELEKTKKQMIQLSETKMKTLMKIEEEKNNLRLSDGEKKNLKKVRYCVISH